MRSRLLIPALCGALWLSGSGALETARGDAVGTTDAAVRAVGDPILDNILKGMAENNYEIYARDFGDVMRMALGEEDFVKANQMTGILFGDYEKREYLGFLTKKKQTVMLWKATFSKTEDDVLIQLVLSKTEDRVEVTGLLFR